MSALLDEYGGVQARYYEQYFDGVLGDLEFFAGLAAEAGSPVIELGCGNGRVMTAMAASGVDVVGIDRSREMLCRGNRPSRPTVPGRTSTVLADMRCFHLRCQFTLATIPYRSFQHLLTPADQRQALSCIRDHLQPDGLLAFNLFDPSGLVAANGWKGEEIPKKDTEFIDPATGSVVEVWYSRSYDPATQLMVQDLTYRPAGLPGSVWERARLTLRYSQRYEIEHLLELCGFRVAALYGDFAGTEYAGVGEQVWIAQKV